MNRLSLTEQDGDLYVTETIDLFNEPVRVSNHYPTTARLYHLKRVVGDEEAGKLLGAELARDPLTGRYYVKDQPAIKFELLNGDKTASTWKDEQPIPAPPQSGRKLPTEYRRGSWWKLTSLGWVQMFS